MSTKSIAGPDEKMRLTLTTRVGDRSLLIEVWMKLSHMEVDGFRRCASGGRSWMSALRLKRHARGWQAILLGGSIGGSRGRRYCSARNSRLQCPRGWDVSQASRHVVLSTWSSVVRYGNILVECPSRTCLHFKTPPMKSTVFLGLYFFARSPGCRVMAAW